MKIRKWVLALAVLLISASACYAAFAIFQTSLPSGPARTQKSLVADYGATCDGVADDTAAFLAFKAAWQGSSPVQLNLPTGTCTFLPAGGGGTAAFYIFRGVLDLVVNGNGSANSSIKNTGSGSFQMAGFGQTQDNTKSLRTNTANAGDSCVIIKTQPSVTVSAVTNSLPVPATFTASVSGTTMTVASVASGTIAIGAYVTNVNRNVNDLTRIVSQSTGPAGGAGDYVVSVSQTVSSQTFMTRNASFTATVDAAGVMTVSAVADGTLAVGMWMRRELGSVSIPTTIKSQIGGTPGGVGTYQLSNAPQSALATSSGFYGNGSFRVTLNATTGLTTGDTLYLTGMTGNFIQDRINGLSWIKVVNGTQIDLFQREYEGLYSSGGTGGGDRTSLTPTGSTVLMTGWSNQSYWATPYAFPSNPHFFEYKKVVSTNPGTHQVCFDSPLVNTYKDTWPQMNTGSKFQVDPGGPATLYAIDPDWEVTAAFQNLTIDNAGNQTYTPGRGITFLNAAFTGIHCPVPTQNETYTWTSVDASSCQIETDKIIKTWNITSSTIRRVTIQSSSLGTVNISNVTANSWAGSPQKLNADNFTLTCSGCISSDYALQVGTAAYGASDESICTNCTIPSGVLFGAVAGPSQDVLTTPAPWTMAGGVITIPNGFSWDPCCAQSETQTRGLVPGHYVTWTGRGGGGTVAQVGRIFKVIDATQDVDNTYIQTNEAGGFPTGAWTTNGLAVNAHPAPKLTVSFIGTPPNSAKVFNGCTAQTPMFSCQNFTYTGGASGTSAGFSPTLWGVLDTFTATNNVPYTNTGSLSWQLTQFNQWRVLKTDLTQVNYGTSPNGEFDINTKLPSSCGSCTRTLTTSGATNTQVGDHVSVPPTGAWFGNSPNGPIFSANTPSDSPQVTITLRTNQQLPP